MPRNMPQSATLLQGEASVGDSICLVSPAKLEGAFAKATHQKRIAEIGIGPFRVVNIELDDQNPGLFRVTALNGTTEPYVFSSEILVAAQAA